MERETSIFPSKAIWTHSMAARATQRLGRGRSTGGATARMTAVRAQSCQGTQQNQGPPLCLDHCVCAKCAWVCRHVHLLKICSPEKTLNDIEDWFFFFFLELQSTLVSRSESLSCFFLFLFCLFFLIYFWQHYWHIILLPCRPCKYFKHWIILGFHDALKHFELAQSPTIHLFLMYYCQTYCSCLTTFVEGFFTLKA